MLLDAFCHGMAVRGFEARVYISGPTAPVAAMLLDYPLQNLGRGSPTEIRCGDTWLALLCLLSLGDVGGAGANFVEEGA